MGPLMVQWMCSCVHVCDLWHELFYATAQLYSICSRVNVQKAIRISYIWLPSNTPFMWWWLLRLMSLPMLADAVCSLYFAQCGAHEWCSCRFCVGHVCTSYIRICILCTYAWLWRCDYYYVYCMYCVYDYMCVPCISIEAKFMYFGFC